VLAADARGEAVAVRDAGFTEIAPGSVTVIAEIR
ncbi:MAG: peptidyl-tRNA hydrolase, partial [Gordonia amarae]